MADLTDDDEFERKSKNFIDWLKQNGTTINPKIELADLRHRSAGRGVSAKEDIAEDEELFSISKTSILTVETSSLPEDLSKKFDNPWLSLIVAMLYEYEEGARSRWKAYFDVLPDTFDTLMYWTKEELEWLQGSAVVSKIGKEPADKTFSEEVIPLIREHAADFRARDLSNEQLLCFCHIIGSTIMAYAFDLEPSERNGDDEWEEDSDAGQVLLKGMIPLADMLNADADRNNAKLFYEDDKIVMKAITAIREGEEILNDYGPLPRADVLRRYGYVTDNYAKYDVVEVSLDMIKETAKQQKDVLEGDLEARLQHLDVQGILDDGYDISRSSKGYEQFGEELAILLNTLVLPKSDFDKLKKKDKLPKPDLSENALHLLYSIIVSRLALYSSSGISSLEDVQKLNQAKLGLVSNDSSQRRRVMAIQVIAGENEVLQEAANTVLELLGSDKKRKANTDDDEANNMQQVSKKSKAESR